MVKKVNKKRIALVDTQTVDCVDCITGLTMPDVDMKKRIRENEGKTMFHYD